MAQNKIHLKKLLGQVILGLDHDFLWIHMGRSGAYMEMVCPVIIKQRLPKRVWLKRKSRMHMARMSRRKNR